MFNTSTLSKQTTTKITHLSAMKKQLLTLNKVKGLGRLLKDSPFRRIPSVSKYDIITNSYNFLLEKLGIKLRLPKKVIYEVIPENEGLNKYMEHILKRIRKLTSKGEYAKAWKVAKLNIKYSKAFRITAFNFVCKGWYYNMALSEVFKINKLVNKILVKELADLDYKRVYIPKPNGKIRPLGVPTKEWRIVLHLVNGFIVEILRSSLLPTQHAYIPQKGTMSAWRDVIKQVFKNKYIYETDLKGFFNEVSVWKILDILNGVKCSISDWIYHLCQSVPKFPGKLNNWSFDVGKVPGNLPGKLPLEETRFYSQEWSKEDVNLIQKLFATYSVKDMGEENVLRYKNFGLLPGGVPQGSPISPFLSILAVKDYLSQQNSINYADDQVFFGNEEFAVKDNPEIGLVHAPDANKCKWVMKDGKWLGNGLKFLGLRLTKDWELMAETRNGVVAGINKHFLTIYSNEGIRRLRSIKTIGQLNKYVDWIVKNSTKYQDPKEVLLNISSRKIFGFVLNCMQINDWSNDHSIEDQRKAVRNHLAKLNKKSLTKRVPSNLDSSKSIPFLWEVMTVVMGGKSNHPFSIYNAKDNGLWANPAWLDDFERATEGPHLNDPMLLLASRGNPTKWLAKRKNQKSPKSNKQLIKWLNKIS